MPPNMCALSLVSLVFITFPHTLTMPRRETVTVGSDAIITGMWKADDDAANSNAVEATVDERIQSHVSVSHDWEKTFVRMTHCPTCQAHHGLHDCTQECKDAPRV
jgi:hypothetical protein